MPNSRLVDRGIAFYFNDKFIPAETVRRLFYYNRRAYEEYIAETLDLHDRYPNEPNVIYIRGGILRAEVMSAEERHQKQLNDSLIRSNRKRMKADFAKALEEGKAEEFDFTPYENDESISPEELEKFKRYVYYAVRRIQKANKPKKLVTFARNVKDKKDLQELLDMNDDILNSDDEMLSYASDDDLGEDSDDI